MSGTPRPGAATQRAPRPAARRRARRRRRRHLGRPRVRVRRDGRAAGGGPPVLPDAPCPPRAGPSRMRGAGGPPRCPRSARWSASWERAARCARSASPASARASSRWTRRDQPLRAGLIYRDNRATAEADWMRERFGDAELHQLTGHVPAAFHVAAKLLWLRAHEPGVFAATRRFVQPTDYVALTLTGNATTDWSMAAATALLDLRDRRWAAGPAGRPRPGPGRAARRRAVLERRGRGPAGPGPAPRHPGRGPGGGRGGGQHRVRARRRGDRARARQRDGRQLQLLQLDHRRAAAGPGRHPLPEHRDRPRLRDRGRDQHHRRGARLARPAAVRGAGPGAAPCRLRPHRAGRRGDRAQAPAAWCSPPCSATASATTRRCAAPSPGCRCATTAVRWRAPPSRASPAACGRGWRPSAGPPRRPRSCGCPARRSEPEGLQPRPHAAGDALEGGARQGAAVVAQGQPGDGAAQRRVVALAVAEHGGGRRPPAPGAVAAAACSMRA